VAGAGVAGAFAELFASDGEDGEAASPDELLEPDVLSAPELSEPDFPSDPESVAGVLDEPPDRLSVL
jgi:hypothetical protein